MADVLGVFVKENQLEKGLSQEKVREVWKYIAGKAINERTVSIRLNGDVLYVGLSSSALREELGYEKSKIVERINEAIGTPLVARIVLG